MILVHQLKPATEFGTPPELDIENFPTLFVTEGERVRFLGAITPQPEVAERLVSSLLSGDIYSVPAVPGLDDIVHALRAL